MRLKQNAEKDSPDGKSRMTIFLMFGTSYGKYRTKLVIVDGVYSQDGDIAPLDEIYNLTKQ